MQLEKRSAHMRFKQKNEKKRKFNGEKKNFFQRKLEKLCLSFEDILIIKLKKYSEPSVKTTM